MDEWARAYHEAGHCVAATVFGRAIKRATLDGVWTLIRVGCPRARYQEAIIALAGPAAEARHRHCSPPEAELWQTVWATDWSNAQRRFAGGDIDPAWRQAQQLVGQHWSLIERLAWALHERGELTGAEIDAVIRSKELDAHRRRR